MKKAPRAMPGRLLSPTKSALSAVEDVRADLRNRRQALAPRRSDIVGVVPQNVGTEARDHVRHGKPGNALGLAPRIRSEVRVWHRAVTDERELRRLLDDFAPAGRVLARRRAVHDHSSDRELPF